MFASERTILAVRQGRILSTVTPQDEFRKYYGYEIGEGVIDGVKASEGGGG